MADEVRQCFKKENRESGRVAYGARFYDPAIARFTSVDPLEEKYSFQNPYAYAANNPISLIDFMGLGPIYGPNGRLIGYEVEEGQGPTQIAEDLNNNNDCEMTCSAEWTQIVYDNAEQFGNVLNGDGEVDDKYNGDYTEGNIAPGDVLVITNGKETELEKDLKTLKGFEEKATKQQKKVKVYTRNQRFNKSSKGANFKKEKKIYIMQKIFKLILCVFIFFNFFSCKQTSLKKKIEDEYLILGESYDEIVSVKDIKILNKRDIEFAAIANKETLRLKNLNDNIKGLMLTKDSMQSIIQNSLYTRKCLLNNSVKEYDLEYKEKIKADSILLEEYITEGLILQLKELDNRLKIINIVELAKTDGIAKTNSYYVLHEVSLLIGSKTVIDTTIYISLGDEKFKYLLKNVVIDSK